MSNKYLYLLKYSMDYVEINKNIFSLLKYCMNVEELQIYAQSIPGTTF